MKDNLPRYTFRASRILLDKLEYVSRYDGRSMNKEIEYLVRLRIEEFEKENGPIDLSKSIDEQ